MARKLKGAIHIHSTYSDGELTLKELRGVFLAMDCHFACISDHAEFFDAEKRLKYVRECDELTDSEFCFLPGLEYSCRERMHILSYGLVSTVDTLEPEEAIRRIEEEGGLAVIAHPRDESFPWIESFRVLPDGIEAWNTKYDGRYAPRPSTFRLIARLQTRNPEMRAFYGLDLHWKTQYRELLTVLGDVALARDEILAALRRGEYSAEKKGVSLPSDGRLPEILTEQFQRAHERSERFRNWAKDAKRVVERFEFRVPGFLKSQMRRLF